MQSYYPFMMHYSAEHSLSRGSFIYSFFRAPAGSAFAPLQYWKPATAIVQVMITTNVNMNVHADMPLCSTKLSSHLLTA